VFHHPENCVYVSIDDVGVTIRRMPGRMEAGNREKSLKILNRHLYIFSDGAQNIRKNIEAFFSFCPYTLMLDWYHLEKKMTERFSCNSIRPAI
jgi:hypothetical protein